MLSRDLIDRLKLTQDLSAVVERLNEGEARQLGERLRPCLEKGETLPDVELMQRLMGRLVKAHLRELAEDEAEALEPFASPDGEA